MEDVEVVLHLKPVQGDDSANITIVVDLLHALSLLLDIEVTQSLYLHKTLLTIQILGDDILEGTPLAQVLARNIG